MSIETLLDRLDGVRESGPGKYLSRCPAHDDRSPSPTHNTTQYKTERAVRLPVLCPDARPDSYPLARLAVQAVKLPLVG